MAGGGNLLQVIVQVTSIVRSLLRVAVLHDQDAPAVSGGWQQGPHRQGLLRREVREQGGGRRLARAQVAAAPSRAERQLGYVGGPQVGGAAVVVVDAARGRAAQGVVVLKVLCQVDQVCRGSRGGGGGAPQSAQLVVRRLEDLLEHGGVKVLPPQDVLLARLLDLDDDGDDEEEEDDATGDANDGPVGVVKVVQDVCCPLFCGESESTESQNNNHNLKKTTSCLDP